MPADACVVVYTCRGCGSVASQVLKVFFIGPWDATLRSYDYAYFRNTGRKIWRAAVIDVAYCVPSLA